MRVQQQNKNILKQMIISNESRQSKKSHLTIIRKLDARDIHGSLVNRRAVS